MQMSIRRFVLVLAASTLATASAARGDLVISAPSLTLTPSGPGSTGRITLTIVSTNGSDVLDSFGVEFRLTSANGHYVSFVNPPTDTQLSNPNYIFSGDSAAAVAGPPSGSISTVVNPDDTYIGGDGTLSGVGVTVPAFDPNSTSKVLVALDITVPVGSGVQAGDEFELTLVAGPSTFFWGPIPQTGGDPPTLLYQFDGAKIQIASAVPEPSSIVLASVGFLVAISGLTLRRFIPINPKDSPR